MIFHYMRGNFLRQSSDNGKEMKEKKLENSLWRKKGFMEKKEIFFGSNIIAGSCHIL